MQPTWWHRVNIFWGCHNKRQDVFTWRGGFVKWGKWTLKELQQSWEQFQGHAKSTIWSQSTQVSWPLTTCPAQQTTVLLLKTSIGVVEPWKSVNFNKKHTLSSTAKKDQSMNADSSPKLENSKKFFQQLHRQMQRCSSYQQLAQLCRRV